MCAVTWWIFTYATSHRSVSRSLAELSANGAGDTQCAHGASQQTVKNECSILKKINVLAFVSECVYVCECVRPCVCVCVFVKTCPLQQYSACFVCLSGRAEFTRLNTLFKFVDFKAIVKTTCVVPAQHTHTHAHACTRSLHIFYIFRMHVSEYA